MYRRLTSFVLPMMTFAASTILAAHSQAGWGYVDYCQTCSTVAAVPAQLTPTPAPTPAPTLAPPIAVSTPTVATHQNVTVTLQAPPAEAAKPAAKFNLAPTPAEKPAAVVASRRVATTPAYDVRRQEVPSGSRLTLFANFLGQEPGLVLLQLEGASLPCSVVQWRGESVTAELPKLSLVEPKNAKLVVIRPEGRIVKTFPVLLINQPDVMVHQETVPQPMPPLAQAGASGAAMMAD